MDKKIIKFDDTEIEEYKFHQNKSPISINNIDINKIVVSNKLRFCKQDFNISLITKILKNWTFMYILSANDYILKEKLSLNICKFQKKLGIS